jgi:dihydropteroate synthase
MFCFEAAIKKKLTSKKIYIMGILNLTPDSFSDGGMFNELGDSVARALQIEQQGADILDIGGQSTRPGYKKIPQEEEWARLAPFLREIKNKISIPISIDTFYPYVAERALDMGVSIINDVSGFRDELMMNLAAKSAAGCVVMCDESLDDVFEFLKKKREKLLEKGVKNEKICLDPGIGFGKTHEENLKILKCPKKYVPQGNAILIGASRKRVTACAYPAQGGDAILRGAHNKTTSPNKRLCATIAAHTLAICGGANIVRVHDVEEAVAAAKMVEAVL